jgi:hypothetical protein
VLDIGEGQHSDGEGLLSLVERAWIAILYRHAPMPRWVDEWNRAAATRFRPEPWPADLQTRADEEEARILKQAGG